MGLPLAVSAALGLTSSALGAYDMFKAGQQRAEADKAATKFGKELEKIAEQQQIVDMPLPSRGAELERQAAEQAMATGVAAAQVAGPEGVIGLVPQLEQQRRKQDLQTAARLERLEFDRNRAAERMRREGVGMMAGLQSQRLAGAGMARAEAERRRLAGMQSIVGGLGQAAELYLESQPLYGDDTTDKKDTAPAIMAGQTTASPFEGQRPTVLAAPSGPVQTAQLGPLGMGSGFDTSPVTSGTPVTAPIGFIEGTKMPWGLCLLHLLVCVLISLSRRLRVYCWVNSETRPAKISYQSG